MARPAVGKPSVGAARHQSKPAAAGAIPLARPLLDRGTRERRETPTPLAGLGKTAFRPLAAREITLPVALDSPAVCRDWTLASMLAAVALAAVSSCGSNGGSGSQGGRDAAAEETADPNAALCARYATDAGAPVPFALIQQIFDGNCVTCHVAGTVLDLSDGHAWSDLVNQPPTPDEACGGTLVVPGNPAMSFLYQKLTQDTPCAGFRMPRSEFGGGSLPACVTDVVAGWITEGAPGGP